MLVCVVFTSFRDRSFQEMYNFHSFVPLRITLLCAWTVHGYMWPVPLAVTVCPLHSVAAFLGFLNFLDLVFLSLSLSSSHGSSVCYGSDREARHDHTNTNEEELPCLAFCLSGPEKFYNIYFTTMRNSKSMLWMPCARFFRQTTEIICDNR